MEKTGLGQKSSLSFSEIIIIIAEDLFEFGVKYVIVVITFYMIRKIK